MATLSQKIEPHTLRGALLLIMIALVVTSYNQIITYTTGGIISGILLAIVAFFVGLLILAPYLSSKDTSIETLIKDLRHIDTSLLPYLPELIQALPVIVSLIQIYGPDFSLLLDQLLADQAQRNNNQVQPPTQ